MTDDSLLVEQIAFYRARANEYDDSYERRGQHDRGAEANAEWHVEMSRLERAFDAADLGSDVLELAAGTGRWTERLVDRGLRVTAVDAAPEALAINADRLGARAAHVDYAIADLFTWQPARTWDSCVACFWLCHVPDDRLAAFLGTVAHAVRPGGAVFFADKATPPPADAAELRTLDDGRSFMVIERPRAASELREVFAAAGFAADVTIFGPRFCAVHGHR